MTSKDALQAFQSCLGNMTTHDHALALLACGCLGRRQSLNMFMRSRESSLADWHESIPHSQPFVNLHRLKTMQANVIRMLHIVS